EGEYLLGTSIARPLIAKRLIEIANETNATAISHGATGKGNDQVRFEVGTHALAPDLKVVAPARLWGMTREDSIEYAAKWNIPIGQSKEKIYSIDENLWGRAIECGAIEDPWETPPSDPYTFTRITSHESVSVVLGFEEGVPVSLNAKSMSVFAIINELNALAGATGFGRLDMVENRRVGIKSREVYECPGALAIIRAHQDLESLTLERDLAREKARLEPRWAELVYDGMWFSPLKEAIDAFMQETQRAVTGEVRMRFDAPGILTVEGRRSPLALYDHGLATYDASDTFNHADAEGFVRLWGLGLQTWADRQGAKNSTVKGTS
ncbi:MAG: argininosuccinate synthase, partial [Actinomycetota bacterium]